MYRLGLSCCYNAGVAGDSVPAIETECEADTDHVPIGIKLLL